ncbi:MAG: hypothetical protein BZY68_00665 [SAR202 cluster bacterium MP-SAtl-SRR3965592-G2]|nr:MAG: hypothetical protein BZY68_00665 [SAR202 cluster bacterium MP-SAtl-SRR3965592-G2]
MNLYDLYLISPQLAVASTGILVILLDLVFQRKGFLPYAAFAGLLVSLALLVIQSVDLSGAVNLVDETESGAAGVLAGSLAVDRFSLFFNYLVLAALGLVTLSSVDYVMRIERFRGEYFGLLLFSATGMMLLASATELITIYISLELTTLPLAALSAFLMTSKSSEAGMKFLIIGAISSAVMLYGMALIYGFTGSTQLDEISVAVTSAAALELLFGGYALLVGVVLMLVGFGFKISSVPFQMWVPDIYEGAPAPVVAFLSVASKAAAVAVLIRVLFTGFFPIALDWASLIAVLAAASMTLGNLAAMGQTNIRRLFGYSTIAHAGYILVGIAAGVKASGSVTGGPEFVSLGLNSVLFYLAAYAAANLTAFFAIIAVSQRTGSDLIEDYAGLVRRAPFLAVVLTLALVALIGVPPTSIFIGKLVIFSAAIKSGLVWLAILGVINSVVSAYYYVRIVRVMFLEPPREQGASGISPVAWFALTVSGVAMIGIGIAPGFVLRAAEIAVGALML